MSHTRRPANFTFVWSIVFRVRRKVAEQCGCAGRKATANMTLTESVVMHLIFWIYLLTGALVFYYVESPAARHSFEGELAELNCSEKCVSVMKASRVLFLDLPLGCCYYPGLFLDCRHSCRLSRVSRVFLDSLQPTTRRFTV